jgi:hypothetical protein
MALATWVALATLIAAKAASAQPRDYRAAPKAYDVESNPIYGFGPPVAARPGDVISGRPGDRPRYGSVRSRSGPARV